jgi:hypothetical protein
LEVAPPGSFDEPACEGTRPSVELLLGLDEINRSDLYATPTDTVPRLTGHPPRTIEEDIEQNRAAFFYPKIST